MSGLSMGQVGAFGPLGPRRDRYGSFGLNGSDTRAARSTAETFEWAAERWSRGGCAAKGANYVKEPASSGCHYTANMAILAGSQMALRRIGFKGYSVTEVEQAILAGRSLGGFTPSQLSLALTAGQQSAMAALGIPVPPRAVPRPPRPGSIAEGSLIQSLESKIAALMTARKAVAPPSPSLLTEEQKTVLGRKTPQEAEEIQRAAALKAVREAQARQRELRDVRAALPPPKPFFRTPALATGGQMAPWIVPGMLLLGAGVVGTIIYSVFGGKR